MNNFQITTYDTDSIFFKKPDGSSFSKEEITVLQESLNSLYPERIRWELNNYFPIIVAAKTKNYLIKDPKTGEYVFKGSALRDPKKEVGLREFIQKAMISLAEDRAHEILELYNFYVREIYNLKDIKRYCYKKTVTAAVLNPGRTTEEKVLAAIKNEEGLQEGDKIFVYFKSDRSLALEKYFDGDYDKMGLLKKLYKTVEIIKDLLPGMEDKLLNYSLKRNKTALESLMSAFEDPILTALSKSHPDLYKLVYSQNSLPRPDKVFRAFKYCQPKDIKVIIIGQDPYPNREDANGLAFSAAAIPASLSNIFKELIINEGIGSDIPKTGNLESWAKQGVLLLNSVLTVEEGKSSSHRGLGWEQWTTNAIQKVINCNNPLIIIAWGNDAKNKVAELKLHDNILILTGGHPSPLNRAIPFFGGKYFSKANEFLEKHRILAIDWKV